MKYFRVLLKLKYSSDTNNFYSERYINVIIFQQQKNNKKRSFIGQWFVNCFKSVHVNLKIATLFASIYYFTLVYLVFTILY